MIDHTPTLLLDGWMDASKPEHQMTLQIVRMNLLDGYLRVGPKFCGAVAPGRDKFAALSTELTTTSTCGYERSIQVEVTLQ